MATPTEVQHATFNNTLGASPAGVFHYFLPNPSLANNCLIISVGWAIDSGTPTLAISDDQSNTWVAGPTDHDATNTYDLSTWYVLGATAGVRKITVTASGGQLSYCRVCIVEFYNVATSAAADGTAHNHGSSATWSPGSLTTATAGDLIYSVAASDGGTGFTNFTPGASFTLLAGERIQGMADQFIVQGSAGAITASLTASKSATFVACAFALKSASAGTAPTADPRIARVQWCDVNAAAGTTFTAQFPNRGNILALAWLGASAGGGRSMSALTDTVGNTWTRSSSVGNTASGLAQWGYTVGVSPSTTNAVTATTVANNKSTYVLYDIIGTGCTFDQVTTATGNQANSGDLTTVSLTPANANGIVLAVCGINAGTLRDLSGASYQTDNPWTDTENGGGNPLHEDNGWGHIYNPNTSAVTFVWTNGNTGGAGAGVADWAAEAIAFSPAGTSFVTDEHEGGAPRALYDEEAVAVLYR